VNPETTTRWICSILVKSELSALRTVIPVIEPADSSIGYVGQVKQVKILGALAINDVSFVSARARELWLLQEAS